jgi:phage tail-like protein
MAVESGYLYLNAGNAWPAVTLSATMQQAGGAIGLRKTGTAFAASGSFLAGPFQVSDLPTAWFRVQATLRGGAASLVNSHVQFFTFVAAGGSPPWTPASPAPFPDPWKAVPRDALDFTVRNKPDLVFFLGGLFRSDGTASPLLDQVRVEYGRDTYAKFLPPIYRKQPDAADFLDRFLGIEQSVLSGIEREIEDLLRLFDPHAAPVGDPPSWLGWLSTWLTFILDEHWAEAEARANLAGAFQLYGKRGTIEGLREYLRIYAGVNAIIEEPAREARIWPLGDPNPLGFSTMLAPGPLQGAVLGTTATVDQSHLTTGEDFGAALFEDVAHRFCVSVYCAELTAPGTLDTVRAVLDREKPAHTTYELCVIEPAMRAGLQARVGIDAIVGTGPAPAEIGLPLGSGALAAQSDLCPETEPKCK